MSPTDPYCEGHIGIDALIKQYHKLNPFKLAFINWNLHIRGCILNMLHAQRTCKGDCKLITYYIACNNNLYINGLFVLLVVQICINKTLT